MYSLVRPPRNENHALLLEGKRVASKGGKTSEKAHMKGRIYSLSTSGSSIVVQDISYDIRKPEPKEKYVRFRRDVPSNICLP